MAIRVESCSTARHVRRHIFAVLVSLFLCLAAVESAVAFTVQKIGGYGDITVLAVEGNYDAEQPGGASNSEPRQAIAKEFYKTHPDDYDFLFVFTNFDFKMPFQEAVAFYMEVRNDVSGIGLKQFDYSWFFGSDGRLQGMIDMGNLANLSSDPMDPDFSFTLGTMSHELMHRWGAYIKVKRPDGSTTFDLLGEENSHWSFLLDTKGSLMYGNPWQDNGDGTFTSLRGRRYYCPLDLYLMGLVDKSEVPPMLLIDSPQTDKTQVSKPGIKVSGAPQSVTIEDIIAAEGDRFPGAATSQKHFKVGCVFAVRPGTFKDEAIPALRAIMNNWVVWHSGLTNGRSTAAFQENPLESLPQNPGPGTLPYQPRQTPAAVEEAVAWLLQAQQDDGSWSDSENTREKDTAAALRTLDRFEQAAAATGSALQWIAQNEILPGTDYLARTIESLAVVDAPAEKYLDELSARQNADGAWGPDQGYLSSPTDTALALRALMASGRIDAPLLAQAVEFLKLNQNPDGGWGGSPQVSDIQTTANVLAAFAPLRVPYELSQAVQTGMYWIFAQQQGDGGFGEGASTVYDTAAALAVFKTYEASPQYFGPAIEYLQSMQSANGSWHSSVFETAVAAEALYAWKDSVDPDLSVISSDIQFSPAVIGQVPETVTMNVTIHNNGLADAGIFDVRLYENTISEDTVVSQASINLGGQSSTVVPFVVTFNDDKDHRLFVVADAGNAVSETNETNNTALAILGNDLNTQPDLQVNTDDMFFTPVVINQMPVEITLEAVIRNTGLSDAPMATVALYQDAISEGTRIAAQQVAVAAQSSATLHFPFMVADGDTHRYYLVADADHQVQERNEYNNTALKLLTSDPTYDFGIRSQDITLSTPTAEMGQTVTISAHIRNYGNRDGFSIPARFYIDKDGVEYNIATLTFDLPAGGQIDRQVTWKADQSGTDMQVVVQIDPYGAFNEVSEANNIASAPLTVSPYPDPNLALTYQDITITPDPALQGQSAAVTARITNTGGGPANAVRIDCSWNREGETPVVLGSRTIDTLNQGQSTEVTWAIDTIAEAGQRQVTIVIDPQNTVQEISEDDNSAFKPLGVLSLPDFLIRNTSIAFSPTAPADGEHVVITVNVQNLGEQAGQNVPVMLYEGSLQIAQGVLATVPGHAQAPITFDYDTTGRSGVHVLNVAVDPNHTIAEQNTDNNAAGRTLAVQDGDLWLSKSYISAGGGGDQAETTFFFRLDDATDVVVVVVNADGDVVRTFDGEELIQTTGASITWDGRDQRGALVLDGDYQIQVRDLLGNVLHSLTVTVDNNMSSLPDAAGTEFLSIKDITCLLPDIAYGWQWFSDESGILFMVKTPDDNAPEYPPGVYTMSPNGSDIRLIVPPAWTDGRDPEYDYQFNAMSLSPDDQTVAVMVTKTKRDSNGVIDELWTMDRFGNHRTLVDSRVYRQDDGTYLYDALDYTAGIQWADNGQWFVYVVSEQDGNALRITKSDGAVLAAMPFESGKSIYEIHWAPDGQRLFYIAYDWNNDWETVVSADISGQTDPIYQLPYRVYADSPQWIDATHFIFTHEDDQQNKDVIVVVDAVDGQVLENFRNLAGGDYIQDLKVHPDKTGFVFVSGPADYYGDGNVLVQYCDMSGACLTLHQRGKYGNFLSVDGLSWSPRGDRLAFVDAFYEKTDENEFAGHLVVMDWPSKQIRSYPVAYPVVPQHEVPTSYHVYTPQDGLWTEQGVLHFGSALETKTMTLPKLTADEQGRAVLRIVQSGTDGATVDAVALKAGTDRVLPSKATIIPSGEDILAAVQAVDGRVAAVPGATVEFEWQNVPPHAQFILELSANEFNDSGSDPGASEPDAQENGTGAYPQMDYNSGSLSWFYDGRWLAASSYSDGTFAIDSKTGEKKFFDIQWLQPELSPHSRFLIDELVVDPDSDCYGRGYTDLWALKSLMNLTAEMKVVRKETYLEISGTAADRNFKQYILEYASADAPDQWHPIRPPVESMVVDEVMAQWVPPGKGNYTIRLTAMDQAGNLAADSQRIAWGFSSPVADLYLDDTFASPNGDGIKDAIALHYTVQEPVNLEFYIYAQQGNQRVATISRSYAAVPAGDGKDTLTWDGRDASGLNLPDGEYRIQVLDYEFPFALDRTPPQVSLDLGRINVETVHSNGDPATVIHALLGGYVLDANIEKWTLETGEGDNPSEWDRFLEGRQAFGSLMNGQPVPGIIRDLNDMEIGKAAGRKFRMIVEDRAGNKSAAVSEVMEELVVLYRWTGANKADAPIDLEVERREDGSFARPGKYLPITHLNTDHHKAWALMTPRKPLEQIVLQYRTGSSWSDGPALDGSFPGVGTLEFQGEIPGLDAVNAIRLKVVGENAKAYFSNPVPTQEYFGFGCLQTDLMPAVGTIEGNINTFEDLASLEVKVRYRDGTGQNREEVIYQYPNGSTGPSPRGEINFSASGDVLKEGVSVTMTGVGVSGDQYFAEDTSIQSCSKGGGSQRPDGYHSASHLLISRPYAACGSQPGPWKINVEATNIKTGLDNTDNWKKISYYLYPMQSGERKLIGSYDLANGHWGSAEVDAFAADDVGNYIFSQGNHPVTAEVETVVDGVSSVFAIDKVIKDGIEQSAVVPIDRDPPQIQMTAPAPGITLCPNRNWSENGRDHFGVDIWGVLHDNLQKRFGEEPNGRFAFYYAYPPTPRESEWLKAGMQDQPAVVPDSGQSNFLGTWDVTVLQDAEVTLRLEVSDGHGNTQCYDRRVRIDGVHPLSAQTDRKLFSPNGDGMLDEVGVDFNVDEAVSIDALVLQAGTPVKTLADGLPHTGGAGSLSWDGSDNNGQPVADGIYTIRVTATDSCGNAQHVDIEDVEVDRTPPAAHISFPQPQAGVGIIVEVTGTADDKNFASYQLDLFEEAGQAPLQTLTNSQAIVREGILGHWNTYGIEGARVLKLTATDKAGNTAQESVRIDLNNRQNLITDLAAEPVAFSPNGDGRLETVAFNFALNSDLAENFDVTLQIGDGTVVRSFSRNDLPGGPQAFVWDGRTIAGQPVADGTYQALLTAVLTQHPNVTHQEQITFILDATAPHIDIAEPADHAFVPAALTIRGSLGDENLEHYSLALTDAAGAEIFTQSGQVNRDAFTFANLGDLVDGAYSLAVNARDKGQIETGTTLSVVVDKTPPKTTLDIASQAAVYGGGRPAIEIHWSIEEENIAQWQLRFRNAEGAPGAWTILDQGDSPASGTNVHTWSVGPDDGLPDGNYILSLYALDKAGWETQTTATVVVDNTGPVTAISEPSDGGYVRAPMAVSGTAADARLARYTVEVAPGECGQAFKWSPIRQASEPVADGVLAPWQALPPDGRYCLRLTAEDMAQNSSQTLAQVKVDTQPPAAPELSGNIENFSQVRLTWTAVDDPELAGYTVYRDGVKRNATVTTATEFIDAELAAGTYQYVVRAVDLAGWESNASNPVALEVDLTPPQTRIATPAEGSVVAGIVTVQGTAFSEDDFKAYRLYAGQGSAPAQWQLIGQSAVPTAYGVLAQWNTMALTSGEPYTLKLEAEDLAGNVGEQRVLVTVDNDPPAPPVLLSATVQDPPGNSVDVLWQANAESDLAGYLLYRDGDLVNAGGAVIDDPVPYLLQATAYADSDLSDGIHEYALVAMDAAGNQSLPSNHLSAAVETRAPKATIADPEEGYRFDQSFLIRAVSPDQDIASVQVQYRSAGAAQWIDLGGPLTSGPYATYLNPENLSLSYGQYNLRAVASDQSGNVDAAPAEITVAYADITPPDAPAGVQARVTGGQVSLTWDANTEPDIAGYDIYEVLADDIVKVNDALVAQTTFVAGQPDALDDKLYSFQVVAVDASGNASQGSESIQAEVYTPWMEQPETPTASPTAALFGQTVAERNVTLYNDTGSGPQAVGTTTADDQGNFGFDAALVPGENLFSAIADDGNGNTSKPSEPIVVVNAQSPAAPTGLAGSADGYDVTLTWNPNTESDLAGYNLYRDGQKRNADVLVTGGTASASIYTSRAGYVRDGNNGSYWYGYADPDNPPIWWQLDLGAQALVSRLELRWNSSDQAPAKFEIQAWTGYAWLPIIRVIGNANAVTAFDLDPTFATDRIRVVIPGDGAQNGSAWIYLSECLLWRAAPIVGETFIDPAVPNGTHDYFVEAVNTLGMVSPPSETISVDVGDVTAPDAPTNLIAAADGSGVNLSWTPSQAADLAGYRVYRLLDQQWRRLTENLVTVATYADTDLANGTYTYRVTAVDAVGNESDPTDSASATVAQALPDQPVNVTAGAQPQGGSVQVCWEAVSGAAGYRLYRATTAGGPYAPVTDAVITDICYLDTGLTDGTGYYYVVHAVDALGNESADSSEVDAVPSDLTAPEAPVIYAPTTAGVPLTVALSRVDILGWAEPGSLVTLFKDGLASGSIRAAAADSLATHALAVAADDDIDNWALSPDGRFAAVTLYDARLGDDVCAVLDLEQGTRTTLNGYITDPVWSPDSTKLAYTTGTSEGDRIVIYDTETQAAGQLTAETGYFDEYTASWSPDGQSLLYIGTQYNGAAYLCSHDLTTGQVEPLAAVQNGRYPVCSPDSRYIAYTVQSYPQSLLYVYDRQAGGDPQLLDDTLRQDDRGRSCVAWSPDGRYLTYVAGIGSSTDIHTWNPSDGATVTLTLDGDVRHFAWLPDARHVALVRGAQSELNLWILTLDGRGQRPSVQLTGEGGGYGLKATADGRLGYLADQSLLLLDPAGNFRFSAAVLSPGENVFTTTATDPAGNISDSSQAIVVNLDAALLPDLTVNAEEIYTYPYAPIQGEPVTFTVLVRNDGFMDARDVRVQCSLWDAQDHTVQIYDGVIDLLAAGRSTTVQFQWDTTGQAGRWTLIVDVDPDDTVFESYEINNLTLHDFYVATGEGIEMQTLIPFDLYPADQDVPIDVELYNGGPARDVTLAVNIVDADLQPVAEAGEQTFELSYAPLTARSFFWNTGRTLEGDYYVHSILRDGSGQLAENFVPFTIDAQADVEAGLVTDRLHYGSDQTVRIHGSLLNQSPNLDLTDLSTRIVVLDPAGEILAEENGRIDYLFDGVPVAVDMTWRTGIHPSGEYTALLSVMQGALEIARAERGFLIDTVARPTGTLSVQPAVVTTGRDVSVVYTVGNYGNTPLTALPLAVAIMDPADGSDLAAQNTSADIDPGGEISGALLFAADYAPGTYPVQLRATTAEGPVVLAAGSLTVSSDASLPVAVSGTLVADPQSVSTGEWVTLHYTLTNESHQNIDQLNIRVSVPEPVTGDLQRTLVLPAGVTLSGQFVVPTSRLVPDSYTSRLLVSLTGNSGEAEVSSASYAVLAPGSNQDPTADAGPDRSVEAGSGCQAGILLDGSGSTDPDNNPLTYRWTGPFGTVSGATAQVTLPVGVHTVTLTVDDGNGGTASDDAIITVQDTTAPGIFIGGVTDGVDYIDSAAAEVAVTDEACGLASETILLDGEAYTPDTIITGKGRHTLTVEAADSAGNSAQATVTFKIYQSTELSVGAGGGQYSDPANLSATLTSHGEPVAGKTIHFRLNGADVGSALTGDDGTAALVHVIDDPDGAYPVTADFDWDGQAYLLAAHAAATMDVLAEDADVAYTGSLLVAYPESFTLAARVTQADDGAAGNLGLARVIFDVKRVNPDGSLSDEGIYTLPCDASGSAREEIDLDIGVYAVTAAIAGDGYYTPVSETVVVPVYDPAGGFAIGGGLIRVTDPEHGDLGEGIFGFVAGYLNGTATGNLEFMHNNQAIILHGTAFDWLVIDGNGAQCQGTGTDVYSSAAYTFRMSVVDRQAEGLPDQFSIRIWQGTDTEADPVYKALNVDLSNGNIWVKKNNCTPWLYPFSLQ